jgi:hypothetical protein
VTTMTDYLSELTWTLRSGCGPNASPILPPTIRQCHLASA